MFLGIEIGGTKLQLGVGGGDGTIAALERAPVNAEAGAEGIRQQIVRLVPNLLAKANLQRDEIQGVGIGFGGPVDTDRGTVAKSHQIAGWEGFPLADWCRQQLGWPAILHNDADTAGLAEACFGAGRGYSPIFYITIGSGIGGGLIVDRQIYRGAGAGAAELGHLHMYQLRFDGPNVERTTTVESVCSGWSIANRARWLIQAVLSGEEWQLREVARADAKTLLDAVGGDLNRVSAQVVAEAARSGNRLARQTLWSTIHVLGWAIAQMITLLCPRRVVIGGGVSLMGDELLFEPLRKQVAEHVFPPFAACYEIVPAELGEAVVVHGAVRLAQQAHIRSSPHD